MANKKNTQNTAVNEDGEEVMSLNDHLRELRNRIIICLVFLIGGFMFCFSKAEQLINILTAMALNCGYTFVTLTPQELLVQYVRMGLLGAILVCVPVLGYEIWAFVKPGLRKNENGFFFCAMIAGFFCFILGVTFAHKISMPFMLQFLMKLNTTDYITASISIENYLSFVLTVYIIFGIIFEMPVVSVILTQFGLLKPKWLEKGRSIAIICCFFLAAVITPPDIVSQIMVAIPMILLYQISIYLTRFFYKMKIMADPYATDEELADAGVKRKKKKKDSES